METAGAGGGTARFIGSTAVWGAEAEGEWCTKGECEGSWYEDMEVSSSLQSGIGISTLKVLFKRSAMEPFESNADR